MKGDIISTIMRLSTGIVRSAIGLGKKAEAPGEGVVVATGTRRKTLVEVAHATPVDAHGLVDLAADHLTMRYIVRPETTGEADIVLAGEGVRLCSSERGPRPAKAGGLP